jgi:hypothetical protein
VSKQQCFGCWNAQTTHKMAEQSRVYFSHVTDRGCWASGRKSSVLYISVWNHNDWRHVVLNRKSGRTGRSLLNLGLEGMFITCVFISTEMTQKEEAQKSLLYHSENSFWRTHS